MIPSKITPINRDQPNYFAKSNCCDWILVQKTGTISFRLGTTNVTVIGSEGCDINIQSPSVEKRHAVLLFDPKSTHFTVKDLQSTNGTYLNEHRLPPQTPAKLNNMDLLRFGYDSNLYEIRSAGNSGQTNSSNATNSDGLMSNDRQLLLGRRMSDIVKTPTTISNNLEPRAGGTPSSDRLNRHVIQGVRANSLSGSGSRVVSPSFTLDSGHGSNSTPSSPAKEMSPLPNSLSSTATSPVPQHSTVLSQDSGLEFGLSRSASEQLISSRGGGLTNSRQSLLFVSEDEKIRKDSLEDEKEGKMLGPVFGGKGDSIPTKIYPRLTALEGSDLSVPNEVFQPQPTSSMSSARNSPIPKSSIPERMPRSHSFNGESKVLTSLYGTPHWWPSERVLSHGKHINTPIAFRNKSWSDLEFSKDGGEDKQGKCDAECAAKEEKDRSDSDSVASKKLSPMAFTVDFGEADTKRCFGIADSISRFAPRHRRNLSLTKAEDVMGNKDEEQKTVTVSASTSKFHRKSSLGTDQNSSGSGNKNPNTNNVITSSSGSSGQKCLKESSSVSPPLSSLKKDQKSNVLSKPRATIMPTSATQRTRTDNSTAAVVRDKRNNNLSNEKRNSFNKSKAEAEPEVGMDLNGVEDATSEAGTYTIKKETKEVQKARKSIDTVFGTENGKKLIETFQTDKDISNDAASLAWVREWAESAAQLQQTSPNESTADSETRFFLQETENLVSAMQQRMSHRVSNNNSAQNSDSEDEASRSCRQKERLMQKPHARNDEKNVLTKRSSPLFREASVLSDSGYALGYASDSSNEGSRDMKITGVKHNRAFAIRRSRLVGYDSDGCTAKNRQSMTLPVRGVSPRPQVGNVAGCSRPPLPSPSPPLLSRNDGGRFSLRVSQKCKTPPNMMTSTTGGIGVGGYSNARMTPPTTSSAKSDLNTKRLPQPSTVNRKPPSSGESRSNSTLTSKEVEFANWKRRKSYNPMRAAAQGKKKDGGSGSQKNEDDSASEGALRSNSQPPASMVKSTSFLSGRYACGNSDEDLSFVVDEMESSHSNSPNQLIMNRSLHEDMYGGGGLAHQNVRSKNKLEALDNLVIATIHSLSVKVRTSSRHLLEKLQVQHCDDENGALLEEMVSQLKDLEVVSSTNSSPTKSSSRELSGTLKNLKKLEQVILVLDRVLCDEGDSEETN